LNYNDLPVSKPGWWFQRVVLQESSSVSFYAMNAHEFGYGGVQQLTKDPFKGRVIFSLWDQGSCAQGKKDRSGCVDEDKAKTLVCGERVNCTNFGGEGTGRRTFFDTGKIPRVGNSYYMVTQAEPVDENATRVRYTGYFHDGRSGKGGWRLISRIEVSTAGKPWWIHSASSFVEQWTRENSLDTRAALFGPSYMSEKGDAADFKQTKTARFSYGTLENHEHVNAWQDAGDKTSVGIATGGNVVQSAMSGEHFIMDDAAPPALLTNFATRALPCLVDSEKPASTSADIAGCLELADVPEI